MVMYKLQQSHIQLVFAILIIRHLCLRQYAVTKGAGEEKEVHGIFFQKAKGRDHQNST